MQIRCTHATSVACPLHHHTLTLVGPRVSGGHVRLRVVLDLVLLSHGVLIHVPLLMLWVVRLRLTRSLLLRLVLLLLLLLARRRLVVLHLSGCTLHMVWLVLVLLPPRVLLTLVLRLLGRTMLPSRRFIVRLLPRLLLGVMLQLTHVLVRWWRLVLELIRGGEWLITEVRLLVLLVLRLHPVGVPRVMWALRSPPWWRMRCRPLAGEHGVKG